MATLLVASVLLVLVDWVSAGGLAVDVLGATAAAALFAVVLVARRTRENRGSM